MVKIKDIPESDRPMERLIEYGAETLSNEELLAILLKTGTRDISAKELSSLLLSKIGGIKKLTNINFEYLNKFKGIGKSKACILLSTLELSHRINKEVDTIKNIKLNNTEVVYKFYKDKIGEKKQEYFYCVYLDNQKKVLDDKLLFIGTINYSVVHPREIFKEAYLLGASAIICIHNHPGGNVLPSKQDIEITNNLVQVGKLLGIKVLDHIIICKEKYYSFLENHDICF
jgi:DNA repair protein RadC